MQTFTTIRYWTQEKIDIPLKDILDIKLRSSIPGWEPDHIRIFLQWSNEKWHLLNDEEWLLLLWLSDLDKLNETCKNFRNQK